MNPGSRITHPIYGAGIILAVEDTIKMGDNNNWDKSRQSSITRTTNGESRYSGSLNMVVKFDAGGPMGWANNASNDVRELSVI
jgi:hypothetical protein